MLAGGMFREGSVGGWAILIPREITMALFWQTSTAFSGLQSPNHGKGRLDATGLGRVSFLHITDGRHVLIPS